MEPNTRMIPVRIKRAGHQFSMNCLKEKVTMRKEKMSSTEPRITNTQAGTTNLLRKVP